MAEDSVTVTVVAGRRRCWECCFRVFDNVDRIYVNGVRHSEDSLCKRGSIVAPETIPVICKPRFSGKNAPSLFLVPYHSLPAELELYFRNLGAPMAPTLGSHVAGHQWKDVGQEWKV